MSFVQESKHLQKKKEKKVSLLVDFVMKYVELQ